MIVSGLPERHQHHAGDMASVALHVLSAMRHITVPGGRSNQLHIRIGIHSGKTSQLQLPGLAVISCYTCSRYDNSPVKAKHKLNDALSLTVKINKY